MLNVAVVKVPVHVALKYLSGVVANVTRSEVLAAVTLVKLTSVVSSPANALVVDSSIITSMLVPVKAVTCIYADPVALSGTAP